MRTGRPLITLLVALLSMTSVPGEAQDFVDRRARFERRAQPSAGISLDEAVQMAQSRFRAKAVKAETVNNDGRRVHQIRLLSPEGKVRTVRVDAETGSMH